MNSIIEKGRCRIEAGVRAVIVGVAVLGAGGGAAAAGPGQQCFSEKMLPPAAAIQQWHAEKDRYGPTFAGSPSWHSYMNFLEKKFREYGLIDIRKKRFTYNRWYTSDNRRDGRWSISVQGKELPVASYWAYSGSTTADGIRAPLVYYDPQNPPLSIAGKIVVFDIPKLPDPLPPVFRNPGGEYMSPPAPASDDVFNLEQWYQVNYASRFGKFSTILCQAGAAGAVQILDMGPDRAAGIYTFPLPPSEFGVPGIYVDRATGRQVRKAAAEGRSATLKLVAEREVAETYFFSGVLPGRDHGHEAEEMILLTSHTDGPNISQENGALGILGVVACFSRVPQQRRARSLLVVLDPQHYMPGGHVVDWYENNRDLADRVVASIGIEHLGQIEYAEKAEEFGPTGRPEVTQLFVHDNNVLIKMAIDAVKKWGLPRTIVQCPLRKGQGVWYGMGEVALERGIPGFGISGYMSAYWSTAARMDSFDRDLAWKQVAVAAQLAESLMTADLQEIAVSRSKKKNARKR